MTKTKEPAMLAVDFICDTVEFAVADRSAIDLVRNLSTWMNTIAAVDGTALKIKRIDYLIQAESTLPFLVLPVLVQTAGNLVDTDDLTETEVHQIIDAACDDDFGWMELKQRPVLIGESAQFTASRLVQGRLSGTIPQRHLRLLEKELNTEYDQHLYLCLVFKGNPVTFIDIDYTVALSVQYTRSRKSIAIR